MKKIINYSLIALCAVAISATSCESSHEKSEALTILESKFKATNTDFVEKTVKPTYRALADNDKKLVEQLSALKTDADVQKACDLWKVARQDWEWSEAFLFGPAGDYGIDPHTDTWPFDRTQFDKYMAKFHPATDESDAAIIDDAIANGQNLTGFHAVEYLIFRDGNARKLSDMTADEIYFAKGAAQDLYLSSLKLVSAWGGEVSADEQKLLDEVEFESKDYGADFKNAGNAGSSYSTIVLATRQIIAGANDIIGEVRDSKIGSPATGEDVNYIESPHARNSIQDFYDNIMSCKPVSYTHLTLPTIA